MVILIYDMQPAGRERNTDDSPIAAVGRKR